MSDPIVRVEEGELQGRLVKSPTGKVFYSFQGIPYAKPPIGSLRFRVSISYLYFLLFHVPSSDIVSKF